MTDENKWKAGQKVFEPARGWGGFPGRVLTIDRVTPSGRAVIGPFQYGPDGRRIGDRYGSRIVPLTDDHRAALALWDRQRKADDLAQQIKWRNLTADELDLAMPVLIALTKETGQ